jgi:glycine C-acetyltransferase
MDSESSVRFICGTQDIHKTLEKKFPIFMVLKILFYMQQLLMQTEVLSLYLEGDAIISDSLNHASIIDGVRLCKAARYRYANCDMEDLEQLIKANEAGSRFKIIVTDGVSLDGVVAPLDKICDCG